MTKSKILTSALLLALASSSNAMVAQDDEMAQIALSVANILNKHESHSVKHALTQEDFDKMVDELSKKVTLPEVAHKTAETRSAPKTIDNLSQADIDRIVAQAGAHKHVVTEIPKHVVGQDDKQAQFDKLFEKLQAQLKVDTINRPQVHAAEPKTIGDKYDQIVAKLMKHEKPVESVHKPNISFDSKEKQKEFDELFEKLQKAHMRAEAPVQKQDQKQKEFDALFEKLQNAHKQATQTKSIHAAQKPMTIEEQENEVVAQLMRKTGVTTNDIIKSVKQESKPVEQAPVGDKYDQIVAQIMSKNGIKNTVTERPVEKKTEEKTSVGCLMAHAGATSTIRKIADATENTFGTHSVRNVRDLLEELAGKVDKINSACEDKFKVEFTHAHSFTSSTCQRDFAMAGTVGKMFKNTHPGSIQRVMTTAKEMLAVREHMKQNC